MGTRGEIIIPLDTKGTVHSYYVNWAYPGDILPTLETLTEKNFVKHAGDGAIRTLGGKSLLPQTNKCVNNADREVGRPRKVAHYLTNRGTQEKAPPEKLDLVKIAAGEAAPKYSLDVGVHYIFDGSKWHHFRSHEIKEKARHMEPGPGVSWWALDEDGNRLPGNKVNERSDEYKQWKASEASLVAAELLKIIYKRFGTAPASGMAESADIMRRRMRMRSIEAAERRGRAPLRESVTREYAKQQSDRVEMGTEGWVLDWKETNGRLHDFSLFGGAGGRIGLGNITNDDDLRDALDSYLEESSAGIRRGRRPMRESIDMSNLMSITRAPPTRAVDNIIRNGGRENIVGITDLTSAAYAGASVAVAQPQGGGDLRLTTMTIISR